MSKINKILKIKGNNIELMENDESSNVIRAIKRVFLERTTKWEPTVKGTEGTLYTVIYSEHLNVDANIECIEQFLNTYRFCDETFLTAHAKDIMELIGARNFGDLCLKYVPTRWEWDRY